MRLAWIVRIVAFAALASGPLAGGPARAASPLTPEDRKLLTDALAKLNEAHEAIRNTVSDCDGGYVAVFACAAPAPGSRTAQCGGPGGSCDVVAAMRETERAADALRKALGQ